MINYNDYGIKFDSDKKRLDEFYKKNKEEFKQDMTSNPYRVLCDILGMSFKNADRTLLAHKLAKPDSECRCQYAVYAALKDNEGKGNTRMTDSDLAMSVHSLAPEAMKHIVDVVKTDKSIYYDAQRHLVCKLNTYNAEVNIADNIKSRLKIKEPLNVDVSKYSTIDGNELTDEQLSVLEMVRDNAVCMINGSAGVGKSFTTKAVVDMLEDAGYRVALLAPTGIASKVLRNYTKHQASTVHMFLTSVWQPDVILIDEMSMVSVHLLSLLLAATENQPRLIFVADNAQLASISCGNIVQDIIKSGIVPRVELTKIFRYNTSGIVTLATDMRHGSVEHLTEQYPDYEFIATTDKPIEQTVAVYDKLLSSGYSTDDVMILCPFNKHIGCDAINKQISDEYNHNEPVRKNSAIKIGDKVINTKNDYSSGDLIANGDIGYLREYKYNRSTKRHDCTVEFDDGCHMVKSIERLKQAYAVSVHKCQGSSADVVVVLIDKSHGFFLSRNLMYTAMTRARKKLIVIGDADAIAEGAERVEQDERDTWLCEFLLDKQALV